MYEEKYQVKSIYDYADRYLRSWFPLLPTYAAFDARLNRLAGAFAPLAESFISSIPPDTFEETVGLIDSCPIITCSAKRKGKVAPDLTDKGYKASKGFYYYGSSLHIVSSLRECKLPKPDYVGLAPASNNDLTLFKTIFPKLNYTEIYADKAYSDKELHASAYEEQGTSIYTPPKAKKGECEELRKHKKVDEALLSTTISSIKQPIESLFNWLQEKTHIQNGSKIRSSNGLLVHAFGKFAAAMALMYFNS